MLTFRRVLLVISILIDLGFVVLMTIGLATGAAFRTHVEGITPQEITAVGLGLTIFGMVVVLVKLAYLLLSKSCRAGVIILGTIHTLGALISVLSCGSVFGFAWGATLLLAGIIKGRQA